MTTDRWPRGMREADAAEYVGLSVSTLRGLKLKTVQLTPGRMVYLREDLDSFLDRAAGRPAPAADFDWSAGFRR